MKILDEDIILVENVKSSLRQHYLLWIILLITVVFDGISTVFFMMDLGIGAEANVLIRWLAYHCGVFTGVAFGKFLQIVAAVIFSALSLKYSRAIVLMLLSLNLLAIYHNLQY